MMNTIGLDCEVLVFVLHIFARDPGQDWVCKIETTFLTQGKHKKKKTKADRARSKTNDPRLSLSLLSDPL